MKFYGNVKGGKLHIYNRKSMDDFVRSLSGPVTIIITNKRQNRSSRQNAYWWSCIAIMAAELRYEKDILHEILKYKFLMREKVDENTGEVFEYLGSTTTLSKDEFAELINNLHRWSAETFNIVLPQPGGQMKII